MMNRIAGYPFASHFINLQDVKIHYVDEGNKWAPVVILLHGVPTWSYCFRLIIPECVDAGFRVIAPDLPGFGFSQKSVSRHLVSLNWLKNVVKKLIKDLQLDRPVLFAHDWGAIIGSLLASEKDHQLAGLILCNGLLPLPGMKAPVLFKAWRTFARYSPVVPVGWIVNLGCRRKLSAEERNGYNLPFKTKGDKHILRWMPRLLPLKNSHPEAEMVKSAWLNLSNCHTPVLTIFGNSDPIAGGTQKIIQEKIPGARNQNHLLFNGGHFLQEDAPLEISRGIIRFRNVNL